MYYVNNVIYYICYVYIIYAMYLEDNYINTRHGIVCMILPYKTEYIQYKYSLFKYMQLVPNAAGC